MVCGVHHPYSTGEAAIKTLIFYSSMILPNLIRLVQ
jgi:hypothetical protein